MSKISLKTQKEIALIAEGGRKLKKILEELIRLAKPGLSLEEIEKRAWQAIEATGGKPAFARVKNYHWATCININEGIVHGIPNQYSLKKGDLISIDLGLYYKGWNTDMSVSFQAGGNSEVILKSGEKVAPEEAKRFLKTGEKALRASINQAYPGKRVGHISEAMQRIIEKEDFSPLRSLTGHGIGRRLHEKPQIPCFLDDTPESTSLIKAGMIFAIEVIYAMGGHETVIDKSDNWTIKTKDGRMAAIFEKTIVVTDDGPLICT